MTAPNLQRLSSAESVPLGDVASLAATTNAVWFVFPVTGRRLCILVYRNQDCLDVVIATAFSREQPTSLVERFQDR